MPLAELTLSAAALFCGLATGLVFGFAVVVMPGIGTLHDREFLRSFQVIDRVIQDNNPLFIIVWLGSAVLLIAAAVLNARLFAGTDRWLLFAATAIYLFGMQLPTIVVNVPLNNRLQAQDLDALDQDAVRTERMKFERRWNQWNRFRTVTGLVTTAMLLLVLA